MRFLSILSFLTLVITTLVAGCATEEPGINPHKDHFYFPTGLALDPKPDRDLLYVTNSNADLKFNGATITVLDLTKLPLDLSRVGQAKLDCAPARIDPTSWECQENQLIRPGTTLRLGDFPSGIKINSDGTRLFTPVRGQDYLAWVDVVDLGGGMVDLQCDAERCGPPPGPGLKGRECESWDCDVDHSVNFSEEKRESLPREPFGVHLNELVAVHLDDDGVRRTCQDGVSQVPCTCESRERCQGDDDRGCCIDRPGKDHLFLAHLLGGEVSFFTSEPTRVVLRDFRGGFFSGGDGVQGGFDLQAQLPGDQESRIYVTSRVDNVIGSLVIREHLKIVDTTRATLQGIYPGTDARGLAFSPGGGRLYVVSRLPSSLVALDMTLEDGVPKHEVLWAVEVCAEPSQVRLGPDPARRDSGAQLAYVVCFGTGQIYVVDTVVPKVVDQIWTGKGPNDLVIDAAHKRAFIANFLENTVGVIDLDPSHTTYNKMVLRIGQIENLVRN